MRPTFRAALLAQLHRVLYALENAGFPPSEESAALADSLWQVKLVVSPAVPSAAPIRLSDVDRAILDALTCEPIPAKLVARETRYSLKYVQNAIPSLVRRGLIRRTPDGISLP